MAHDCLADGRPISASIKRENQTQAFPVNNFITEMCSTLQQLFSCPQLRACYPSSLWSYSSHLSPLPVSVCGVAAPECETAEALVPTSMPHGFTMLDSQDRASETLLSQQRVLKQGFARMVLNFSMMESTAKELLM